jgi:T-complex protein 1 subunit gamma
MAAAKFPDMHLFILSFAKHLHDRGIHLLTLIPICVADNTKRESGRKAQRNNIAAAKAVCSVVRTALGPRAMLKMILDSMGGIVLTNDGNAILRELEVSHPAGKSMIELSKTQDEEVGDGTTSVIILGTRAHDFFR